MVRQNGEICMRHLFARVCKSAVITAQLMCVSLGLMEGSAHATTTWDLTAIGSSAQVGSGFFRNFVTLTVLPPFLSITDNTTDVSQGYNTDARPVQFDESTTLTQSLLLTSVPIVTINMVAYREFILDINQLTTDP